MADYPDLLLSYRVVFQLVSAILADDVGFLMSFPVSEFCVYAEYT